MALDQTPSINTTSNSSVKRHLSLWDSVSIILGIVVGAGIYETAPLIFSTVSSPWMAMGVWALGGFLSLVGALCYAELASTYPKSGGDYVYLTRAFGSWVGFLFGWAQLAVILTGSIGMMAYIFADYAAPFSGWGESSTFFFAVSVVLILSVINLFLVLGKKTQNFFTVAKILGLGLIVVAGFLSLMKESSNLTATSAASPTSDFPWSAMGLAMVFVLYTYGGWNDAAFVAAELKDRKHIPKSLILGTLAIVSVYLLVNAAYLAGLGFEKAQNSRAIAADLLNWPFGTWGSGVMSFLVMISALGAVNGLIFTGSRVYAALGSDHKVFNWLSRWHPRLNSPVYSLAAQTLVTILLISLVGSSWGRGLVNGVVSSIGLPAPQWEGHGGFETLLRCTAPIFWLFFLLTGLSLFVLRFKDSQIKRPFKVPFYPITPILFCATCAYMLYRSIDYAGSLTIVGLVLLLIGLPLFFIGKASSKNFLTNQYVLWRIKDV